MLTGPCFRSRSRGEKKERWMLNTIGMEEQPGEEISYVHPSVWQEGLLLEPVCTYLRDGFDRDCGSFRRDKRRRATRRDYWDKHAGKSGAMFYMMYMSMGTINFICVKRDIIYCHVILFHILSLKHVYHGVLRKKCLIFFISLFIFIYLTFCSM